MTQYCVSFNYIPANIADDDLEKIDHAIKDLNSSFSGPSSPSNAQAGQVWYDSTKKILRHAQSNGSTFRGIFAGSASFKIWAYLDSASAEEGWARDSTVTDVVLGLKSTSGTYATGATVPGASSWTISGISAANESSHTHTMQSHVHSVTIGAGSVLAGVPSYGGDYDDSFNTGTPSVANTSAGSSHGHTISHTPGWRIRAAVGIMVYPDI